MEVVGVDATKGGWVAIALDNGHFAGDFVLRPVGTTFDELADAKVIAIDIPIGCGPRRADAAARGRLKGAASTVFSTPARHLLEAQFRPGLGVSAQSHALGERILHVTDLAQSDGRLREVHPEISFLEMNCGVPLGHRKKSAAGAMKRMNLLQQHGIDITQVAEAGSAPLDDVLDAAAAAWSADRILKGEAKSLPDAPEDIDGYPVAIWY